MKCEWTRSLPNLLVAALLLVGGLATADGAESASLSEAEFQRLHRLLRPAPNAAWRSIPWKIALLDAQRAAAAAGKPIFIWAMDGHPLGCT